MQRYSEDVLLMQITRNRRLSKNEIKKNTNKFKKERQIKNKRDPDPESSFY